MSNMSKVLAKHLSYINVVNSSIGFVLHDSFNFDIKHNKIMLQFKMHAPR